MNRRKTIERRFSLSRFFGAPRNRRLRQRRAAAAAAAESAAPRPPRDWHAAGARLARVAVHALKGLALLAALGAAGLGGYHGHRRATSSTYFNVKSIVVLGTRQAPRSEIVRSVESTRGKNILSVDLKAIARAAQGHPWVKRATVRRELPDRITIEVIEHRAEAVLLLGHLYLVGADGEVFKRAALDEALGLPVITGIDRLAYLNEPAVARARMLRALETLRRYYEGAPRPPLSEVNVGERDQVTLHLRQGGIAVRLGAGGVARLKRFDRVWAALGPDTQRVRVVYLDNEIRADRVTVRLGASE
jgi:cell division protein FtsQ